MRAPKLCVLLALGALVLEAGPASAWTARIAGVESVADHARSIVSDANGNLLAAGDADVAKYAVADGKQIWRTRLLEVVDTTNFLGGVAVDAAGDVVVTGTVASPGNLADALVVKLSGADGRVLWRFRFDGTAHGPDYLTRAAFDANGDVIAGGTTHLIAEDMLLVKLDGTTGAEKWRATIPGPGVGQDQGLAVAVDANGDVALAGDSTVGTLDRFAVIKVSGVTGRLIWRAFAGGANDNGQATGVAFDSSGDVLAVGSVAFAATGFDVTVVKLDGGTGAERWHRYLDGSAHEFDFGADLAVDGAGNVVAVGTLVDEATGADVLAVKLAPDGSELWRRLFDGGQSLADRASAVALAGDRVVLAAEIDSPAFGQARFAALGLEADNGVEAWRRVKDGDAGGRDQATDVTVGIAGSVFVSGKIANLGTKDDGIVLNLDAASGAKHWRLVINDTIPDTDAAEAVAIDANGDVVATGRVGTRRRAEDFVVVKLAGASGTQAWRTDIDGLLHQNDVGNAVLVDGAGDVLAAGVTVDAPGLPPTDPRFPGPPPKTNVTVVKLDGGTGAEKWRRAPSFAGRGFAVASDLALSGGDVVVGGWFVPADFSSAAAVVKLAGDSGAEDWRVLLGDSAIFPEIPVAVEVDAAGDVVAVVGSLIGKLRGADGMRLWQRGLAGLSATALALDPQGDAVVAGSPADSMAASKLAGVDGTPVWTTFLGIGRALAVAIDPAGDVLLTGAIEHDYEDRLAVFKLAGANGAVLWSRVLPGKRPSRGRALVVDAAGDALVAGAIQMPGRGDDLAVVKLRAADGVIKWRRQIDGGARLDDRAQAIALDAQQNAIAAGVVTGAGSGEDFAVVKFDGRTGRHR